MKRKSLVLVVAVTLCALGILYYYKLTRLMPLLNPKMTVEDIHISYESSTGSTETIDYFDRELVLERLDACTIKWFHSGGGSLGQDLKFWITLRQTDGDKSDVTFIYLGDQYTVMKDKGDYRIINGGDGLFQLIDLLANIDATMVWK